MFNLVLLKSFFGWCFVINLIFFIFSTTALILFKNFALNTHEKLTGLKKEELKNHYFKFLANYKILIIFFNLVPYFVLSFMDKL